MADLAIHRITVIPEMIQPGKTTRWRRCRGWPLLRGKLQFVRRAKVHRFGFQVGIQTAGSKIARAGIKPVAEGWKFSPRIQRVNRRRDANLADVVHTGHASRGFLAPAERRQSEEHTSELQSQSNLVCRLLLETKKTS